MVHLHLETMGGRPENNSRFGMPTRRADQHFFHLVECVYPAHLHIRCLSRAQEWNWRGNGTVRELAEMDPASLRAIRELGPRELVQQLEEVKRQVQQVSER